MKKVIVVIVIVLALTVITAGCLGGESEKKKEPKITLVAKSSGPLPAMNGHTGEGEETIVDIPFNETYITQVTIKLTWTDTNDNGDPEPAQDDTFTIEAIPPNGTGDPERRSGMGSSLEITINSPINPEEPMENGAGWTIMITIDPGEGTTAPGLGRFIWYADSGNDWTLNMEYNYLEAAEETT